MSRRLLHLLFAGIVLWTPACGEDDPPPHPDPAGERDPPELLEAPLPRDASPDAGPDLPDRDVPLPDEDGDTLLAAQGGPAEALPDTQTAVGIVGVTGTEAGSLATLRGEERGTLGLTGTLAREVLRLGGARVRIHGRRAATAVGPGLEILSYQLLEVEGQPAHLGTLSQGPGDQWLLHPEDDDPLGLIGLPPDQLQEGMKIWVVGELDIQRRLVVESYGIVSPGPT